MKINLKKYHPQDQYHTCAPACLRMVFEHLGEKYAEEELIELCQVSERYGTSHQCLIDIMKNKKLEHYAKNKGQWQDLIDCVESGYLAIINYLDPSSDIGHYAVVTGYVDDSKEIILADPFNGNDFSILWEDLEERWYNNNKSSYGWFIAIGEKLVDM